MHADLRTRQLAAELEDVLAETVPRKEHERVLGQLSVEQDKARRAEAGIRRHGQRGTEAHSLLVDIEAWIRHALRREMPPELGDRVRAFLDGGA